MVNVLSKIRPGQRLKGMKEQAKCSRFLLYITLKHFLSLHNLPFIALITHICVTSPIKPMWIKKWLTSLLSLGFGMEHTHICGLSKRKRKRNIRIGNYSLRLALGQLEKETHSIKSSWKATKANCDSKVCTTLVAHSKPMRFLLNL